MMPPWLPWTVNLQTSFMKDRNKHLPLFNKSLLLLLLLSLQSCPTLCDPIDGSPPGSPVPGILQARILEWVAISFSNAGKWKVKVKSLSHVRLLAPHGLQPIGLLHPWDFLGKSTGVAYTIQKGELNLIWGILHLTYNGKYNGLNSVSLNFLSYTWTLPPRNF